jgi:hypothetical protein
VRQGLADSLLLAVGGATAAALLTLVTMLEMWQEARFSNVAVLALTVVANRRRRGGAGATACGERLVRGRMRGRPCVPRLQRIVMAGLDPAIPLRVARPCLTIGIAGSSPAMTEVGVAPQPPDIAAARCMPSATIRCSSSGYEMPSCRAAVANSWLSAISGLGFASRKYSVPSAARRKSIRA